MIGTIIIYDHTGIQGACGQTVGADGSGRYAVVFHGESAEETDAYAREWANEHLVYPYIKNIKVVSASETYSGNPILEVHICTPIVD